LIPLRHHQPRELLAHRLAPGADGGNMVIVLQAPVRELRLRAPYIPTLRGSRHTWG
jgi:hypothetical protein